MMSCIYKISFKSRPGTIYIGSAKDYSERKIRHRYQLKKGVHRNQKLQRLYNKLSATDIEFSILEITDVANLICLEQFYIDMLKPELNILKSAGNNYGYRHDQATRDFLSSINRGKKMTEEQNIRNRLAQIGNKNAKGAVRSVAFRKAISERKKRRVINIESGFVFDSIGDAASAIGLKYEAFYAKLSGKNSNNTKLKFL